MGGEDESGGRAPPLWEEATERSITEEEAPGSHRDSEEEHGPAEGDEERWEEEGKQGTSPPPSTEGGRERASRRGRSRRRTRVRDRTREAVGHLTSRPCSLHDHGRKVITSLTHLGLAGREEGLDYLTFDRCTGNVQCGPKGGPVCTEGRCPGCTVRAIGTGFYPKATGKRLLRMKTLWLSLRGDRTGMRAVLGDRVLLHQ